VLKDILKKYPLVYNYKYQKSMRIIHEKENALLYSNNTLEV